MFKHEKLNFFIFAVLILLQVLGVIGLLTRFHLSYLPVMIVLYFWGGMSDALSASVSDASWFRDAGMA